MKKILFATTALVATAGMAAAEVSFSGYGRFGLQYIEDNSDAGTSVTTVTLPDGSGSVDILSTSGGDLDDTFLESRFRLNIDGSTETDGGVAFSARVRLQADDNADGSAGEAGLNGARFTTQYEGFRVDVGNIAGVIDNLQDYYGFEPGLTLFTGQYVANNFDFDAYTSTGAGENGIYAQYTFGAFTFAASYSGDDSGSSTTGAFDTGSTTAGSITSTEDSEQWGVSAAYAADTWGVALAYAQSDANQTVTPVVDNTTAGQTGVTSSADSDMVVLTGHATFGAFTVTALVGNEDSDADPNDLLFDTFWGLSTNYEVGAATDIQFSYADGNATNDTQAFGLGAIHDLGGGVSLRGGVGTNKVGSGSSTTVADLGVQFNF